MLPLLASPRLSPLSLCLLEEPTLTTRTQPPITLAMTLPMTDSDLSAVVCLSLREGDYYYTDMVNTLPLKIRGGSVDVLLLPNPKKSSCFYPYIFSSVYSLPLSYTVEFLYCFWGVSLRHTDVSLAQRCPCYWGVL